MLFDPWDVGTRRAKNRVIFGPHVTNLGQGRSLSSRHVAYYERRARGGAGVIVIETASIHDSDWPYERAPLASECADGYARIATALHAHGSLAIASLGHCGLQGSTTYSQGVLWAPSVVANVMTHEMPIAMELAEISLLRESTRSATGVAVSAGCDGVELNVGQFSLFRQFLSGLTNHRGDEFSVSTTLVADVLGDLRDLVGDGVVGLRFAADELAPWAGITAEMARVILGTLDEKIDYVVIERGSIFSEAATHADMQAGTNFNSELLRGLRGAVRDGIAVVAQGSIVDANDAEDMLAEGICHAVEMTRAQIADPDLVAKLTGALIGDVRPCVLCNQGCQVRDVRNPIVSCSVNPTAGHEISDAGLDDDRPDDALRGRAVTIAGAGPAGLETARRAALRGARVEIFEASGRVGGALLEASALPGRDRWMTLIQWYERELARLGVNIVTDRDAPVGVDVAAVGRTVGPSTWRDGSDSSIPVRTVSEVLVGEELVGRVVVLDPIGGVVGVGVAELVARAGHPVVLVTPDLVAATQLSLTGDLVGANARLANLGVEIMIHSVAVALLEGDVVIEDRYNGEIQRLAADTVVDAGFDLPTDYAGTAPVIGDALAPRTIYAAVLEGRRAAASLSSSVSA